MNLSGGSCKIELSSDRSTSPLPCATACTSAYGILFLFPAVLHNPRVTYLLYADRQQTPKYTPNGERQDEHEDDDSHPPTMGAITDATIYPLPAKRDSPRRIQTCSDKSIVALRCCILLMSSHAVKKLIPKRVYKSRKERIVTIFCTNCIHTNQFN